jgi:dTDP-4-dehydrorhamnose reductase
MKILLTGANGMIGNPTNILLKNNGITTITMGRSSGNDIICDFLSSQESAILNSIERINPEYIINLAGVTRQRIRSQSDHKAAINLNTLLPSILEKVSLGSAIRVITVGTDCVFSGKVGNYSETSEKDGSDIYALTKRLGEIYSPSTMHIRTSVVGFGSSGNTSLFDWFKMLDSGSKCPGFTNHHWNGVTNLAISRILFGVIREELFESGEFHISPANQLSKYELLSMLAKILNRKNIQIIETESETAIDRTLTTDNSRFNHQAWLTAGYSRIPEISELMSDLEGP